MKKLFPSFIILLIFSLNANAQTPWTDEGDKVTTDHIVETSKDINLGDTHNTYTQLTNHTFGGSHGLLFNAYKSNVTSGNLSLNTKFANEVGGYSGGAGALMFYGNGGRMDFLISPSSTGQGDPITWGDPKMSITRTGFIGIGTNAPLYSLDISRRGNNVFRIGDNNGNDLTIDVAAGTGLANIVAGARKPSPSGSVYEYTGTRGASRIYMADGAMLFFTGKKANDGQSAGTPVTWKENIRISSNGNVGIGSTNPDSKLTVNGVMHSKEVLVDLNVIGPDYVFESDYDLMPLSKVKEYIQENKHLPEVPSAKTMETEGIRLSDMNMLLLKKVEELTLYQIDMVETYENKMKELELKNKQLEERLNKLEKK